jgi:hypothetical protein
MRRYALQIDDKVRFAQRVRPLSLLTISANDFCGEMFSLLKADLRLYGLRSHLLIRTIAQWFKRNLFALFIRSVSTIYRLVDKHMVKLF